MYLDKLNKMSVQQLTDFYWLKMYPQGLEFNIKNGKIAGVSRDLQFLSF